jgi:hypothetical protein
MTAFTSLKAPEDIASYAADSAELDTVNVKCFCSREYGKYISCFIETGKPAASILARAMGGDVIGERLVNFIVAIPPDFACKGRDERQLVTSGRCLCRRGYSKQQHRMAA